jgi:hypothetical protein
MHVSFSYDVQNADSRSVVIMEATEADVHNFRSTTKVLTSFSSISYFDGLMSNNGNDV